METIWVSALLGTKGRTILEIVGERPEVRSEGARVFNPKRVLRGEETKIDATGGNVGEGDDFEIPDFFPPTGSRSSKLALSLESAPVFVQLRARSAPPQARFGRKTSLQTRADRDAVQAYRAPCSRGFSPCGVVGAAGCRRTDVAGPDLASMLGGVLRADRWGRALCACCGRTTSGGARAPTWRSRRAAGERSALRSELYAAVVAAAPAGVRTRLRDAVQPDIVYGMACADVVRPVETTGGPRTFQEAGLSLEDKVKHIFSDGGHGGCHGPP